MRQTIGPFSGAPKDVYAGLKALSLKGRALQARDVLIATVNGDHGASSVYAFAEISDGQDEAGNAIPEWGLKVEVRAIGYGTAKDPDEAARAALLIENQPKGK